MPAVIRPKNVDPAVYLRYLYQKCETDIINEILRKRTSGYVDYAETAALQRVQDELQGLVDESFVYVPKMIEKRFYDHPGASQGYSNAKSIIGGSQRVLMEQLVDNLLGEIMEATAVAGVTAGRLYQIARMDDDELRKAALSSTAYAEALGKGAATSAKLMEAAIRNHGLTAYIDKSGRHWSLTDYCNMATRTTARQAEVAAVLSQDEHDLYQIVKIGSTCPICAVYEGRVYSKSGTNPNYPPLAMAFGKIDPAAGDDLSNTYLNIHPNCLHSLIKFTEMGKSEKQLQRIREFSSPETNPLNHDPRSKKQIEAYREKERNRAKKLRELRAKETPEMLQAESSHKGHTTRSTEIARTKIESADYGRRISKLKEDRKITDRIKDSAREILNHRNGTLFEDLVFVGPDGRRKINNTMDVERGVPTSRSQKAFLRSYPEYSVISIHNHPQSTVPSPEDIDMAAALKYKYGLIVGHDGLIIKYKPDQDYSPILYNSAIRKLEKTGYNEIGFSEFIENCKNAGILIEVL